MRLCLVEEPRPLIAVHLCEAVQSAVDIAQLLTSRPFLQIALLMSFACLHSIKVCEVKRETPSNNQIQAKKLQCALVCFVGTLHSNDCP